jgi:undecaprenyl diphosphate synthase
VPRRLLRRMDETTELTAGNRRMTLTIAFNYGGRAEIVDAVRRLVDEGVSASKVTEAAIRRRLYLPDMPDPDLVVRTSGEHRISNFLLWELAYSELVFSDVLWPDFRRQNLFDAVGEFQQRSRRFGGVNGKERTA